jgi:uncharacterized protein (TIGR00255 family)
MELDTMVMSMTGYGRASATTSEGTFTVEMRSVNHRYLDISFRMPRELSAIEDQARATLTSRLGRGKVDVFISMNRSMLTGGATIDIELARAYAAQLRRLADELQLGGEVSIDTIVRMPDVVAAGSDVADPDELWKMVQAPFTEALSRLEKMRRAEGEQLVIDMLGRLEFIEGALVEARERAPLTVEAYRARLLARVAEMVSDARIDEARLATETALFADRCDYTEETVRFASHIKQFRDTLRTQGPIGKKLDFITQEMNREANTVASKAQDAQVLALAVEIKSELEKIREQVQNIE